MTIVDRRYSVAEGTAVKAPCLVATTANITLSGLQSIDGVTVAADDRVLVKDQSTGADNGIYTASSGNWLRTRDFDGAYDIVQGTRIFVTAGSTLAGNEYYVSTASPITVGTTSITFTQMPASGIAASAAAAAASAATAVSAASASSVSAASAAISAATFQFSYPVTGTVGDGVADDRAALQTSFDAAEAAGSGNVHLAPNKTYRVVINSGVTNICLTLNEGLTLHLNGATINFECDDQVHGLRPLSHTRIIGPGTIQTTVSTNLNNGFGQNQAIWHGPISFGEAYGAGGTVGDVSPYLNVTDIVIDGVTINSARDEGGNTMVTGYGGMSHITIRNCTFPDNSTSAIAIGFDWAFVGNVDSSDLAGTATRYLAGTAYTVHPHDITIQNNTIGHMTMPLYVVPNLYGTHGIRLSGVYNFRVVGNDVAETNYAGIFITGGDVSFEFAPGVERFQALKNILVDGNILRECNTYYGIYYDAHPDNVYRAATDAGNPQYPYAAMYYDDGYQANTRIIGNNVIATTGGGVSVAEGIFVQFSKGGLVGDNVVQGFKTGIRAGKGAADVDIARNAVSLASEAGILVSDSSALPPAGIRVINNRVLRNCTDGGTQGNIRVDVATRTVVQENHVGSSDEDQSSIGINITSGSTHSTLKNNRVQQVKTGGTAYVISDSTTMDAIWECHGNRYDGADTFMSGLPIIPIERTRRPSGGSHHIRAIAKASAMTAGVTPTIGTWNEGDLIYIEDAGVGTAAIARKRSVWAALVLTP
jgi:hypothetical protein